MFPMAFIALLFSSYVMAENLTKLFVELSPAGSFECVSQKMKGDLLKSGGKFSSDKLWVNAESFKTGIDLRDEHLWKHLQNSRITMYNVKGSSGKATAILEINKIKKPINMVYTEKDNHIKANFTVLNSDYLPSVKYMGVGVEDIVKVEVTYPFKEK
jgi:hypothetical protein